MISRRRILSRSRDELNYNLYEEEEGVWYNKDQLFKDHIQEILNKWEQIDDEIWAKIICMENKRRVAKAYARAPVLTIDGSQDGFDGYRIGLNGFENPLRDANTEDIMRYIGKGCRVKIDESGNIVIKRYSRSAIYVKGCDTAYSETSVSNDIIKNKGLLDSQKPYFLFDMMKFERNMTRELRSAYPDRKKLEKQCISCVSLVKDSSDVLELPVWIMIINIVALDLLKTKFPKLITGRTKIPSFVSVFNRSKQMTEEDPYTLPANGSSYDSNYYSSTNGTLLKRSTIREPKPPKLPPRDFGRYKKPVKSNPNKYEIPTPDYSQDEDICTMSKSFSKKMHPKYDQREEDPYYSGMEARVTKFAKKPNRSPPKSTWRKMRKVFSSGYINTLIPPLTKKKRSKSYYYNSSDSDPYATLYDDSPYQLYEPIYVRVNDYHNRTQSMPRTTLRRNAYISEWDDYKRAMS